MPSRPSEVFFARCSGLPTVSGSPIIMYGGPVNAVFPQSRGWRQTRPMSSPPLIKNSQDVDDPGLYLLKGPADQLLVRPLRNLR